MARLWQTGFGLNSVAAAVELDTVSGTASIQSAVFRSGSGPRALRINPTLSTGFVRQIIFATDQSIPTWQRVAFRPDTLPSANTTIMRFVDTANAPVAQIRLTPAGTLVLLDSAATVISGTTATVSTGNWNVIELGNDPTAALGTIAARLGGTQFASGTNAIKGLWGRIIVGALVSCTMDGYFTDWAVNDNTGSAQTSWPGDGRVLTLMPDAAGDNNGWADTANAAGTTNNFTLVDEVPPDDATTLVQSGVLATKDFYNVAASGIGGGDTVNVVSVGVRMHNNVADAVLALKTAIKKTSAGTVAQGSAVVHNSTTWATNSLAAPHNPTLVTYLDPDGAAWTGGTGGTVDSMQIGVEVTAAGTQRMQVSTLWASVDYTPSAAPPAQSQPPPLISQYNAFF